MMTARKVSILALFIALSVAGASIKVPAIVGSVALDVAPALMAVLLLGTRSGIIVAAGGHLLSALLSGMPLGPFHFIIAVEMALLVLMFQILYKKVHKGIAYGAFIVSNSFIAPIPFYFILSDSFYYGLLPSLLVGSILNSFIAILLLPKVTMIFKSYVKREVVK